MTLKCPVNGGPTFDGLASASTYIYVRSKCSARYNNLAHLVVDKAPLLQKCMYAHDGTYISREISPACGHCEVFDRV